MNDEGKEKYGTSADVGDDDDDDDGTSNGGGGHENNPPTPVAVAVAGEVEDDGKGENGEVVESIAVVTASVVIVMAVAVSSS